MSIETSKLVLIGEIGKSHGLRGSFYVNSYTDPVDNISRYKSWLIQLPSNNQLRTLTLEQSKLTGSKKIIATCKEITDCDLAKQLTHARIFIQREQLAEIETSSYYWHDLIGMQVINQEQRTLGKITELFETGSNDVMVVKTEETGPSILIPYLDSTIISVDLKNQTINVDWDPDDYAI